MDEKEIFSGGHSVDMWKTINTIVTVENAKDALYFVCCRIQELESKLDRIRASSQERAEQ